MFKYLLALIIVVGGFKAYYAYQDYVHGSPSTVQSEQYQFQVVFPNQHEQKEQIINSANLGQIKLTTYSIYSHELQCSVSVSDYLESRNNSGDFLDLIESSRRQLLKSFNGKLTQGEFFDNGEVTGYEFNMTLKKGDKSVLSQVYKHQGNAYKLLCEFENDTKYQELAYDFMHSFSFT